MSYEPEQNHRISIRREDQYRFRVRFDTDGVPDLVTDEPPPLGGAKGPNPTDLLGAAIGNCLASSLLFCFRKSRVDVSGLDVGIVMVKTRNEQGRLRISEVKVEISPEVHLEDRERVGRCASLFESFCTITESIRQGIPIEVYMKPRVLEEATPAAD